MTEEKKWSDDIPPRQRLRLRKMEPDEDKEWEQLFDFQLKFRQLHKLSAHRFSKWIGVDGDAWLFDRSRRIPSKREGTKGWQLRNTIAHFMQSPQIPDGDKDEKLEDIVSQLTEIENSRFNDFQQLGIISVSATSPNEIAVYLAAEKHPFPTEDGLLSTLAKIDPYFQRFSKAYLSVFT